MNFRLWFKVTLINFALATTIGALLRFAFVSEIPGFHFRNFLHAHSHVAMLGWIYLALFLFFVRYFIPVERQGKYKSLFWLTQLSVAGMLISFPLVGYASWSIGFSTVHMLLSYVFAFNFFRDNRAQRTENSLRFAKAALLFMLLSSLALWGMIPIMVLELQGKSIYYMAIQYYLHFQFNGWFIFGLLALFFRQLENDRHYASPQIVNSFFLLLALSCVLTFTLVLTWSEPVSVLFFINSLGVSLQLVAGIYFLLILKHSWAPLISKVDSWGRLGYFVAGSAFFLKILIQCTVIVPYIAQIAYTIRNLTMAFLHLLLIGVMSFFLLGLAARNKYIRFTTIGAKAGILLLLTGFVTSELLLFVQGIMFWQALGFLPYYYESLFAASALMPIGILGILMSTQLSSTQQPPI